MALSDPNCPVCSADIPLAGDERVGDEIFCTYCGAPCRLLVSHRHSDDEEAVYEAEEDF
jgi:DNA-directed RNA polymerase subunit RPC12/RpoP